MLESQEGEREIDSVVTAIGSEYRYLPDGTTQRYQKAKNHEHTPQLALVFVPDYETLKKYASPELPFEDQFGDNETRYEQTLLGYVRYSGSRNYIVNKEGKKLETNQEIAQEPGPIYLTFGSEEKVKFTVPVSKKPQVGYYTYDTRKYYDEDEKEWKRERHLGNKVVEIRYKK